MKLHIAVAFAALLSCSFASAQERVSCGLTRVATHVGKASTPILSAASGERVVFFKSDMDVNTDGAARSYHPADPRGRSIALNNIANAITNIYDKNGININCSPRTGACFSRYITTFENSRDANYVEDGVPRFKTTGIIPWHMDSELGRSVPCVIKKGPNAGYFVSQTAFIMNSQADICDQNRYMDSLTINAIVLPKMVRWSSQGAVAGDGDLVATLDLNTGNIAYAIVGDRGPRDSLGEGTIALAAALGGRSVPQNARYPQIVALKRQRVAYLVFADRNIRDLKEGNISQVDINDIGEKYLSKFGGRERLISCAKQ